MLRPVRTSAPSASDPLVSTTEAVRHCRVDESDAVTSAVIGALVQAVTDHLDGWGGILGRALVTQTWRQDFGYFCDKLRLPLEPLVSVSSVTYYDEDNASQTLATSVYTTLTDERGPYITLKPDQEWPDTYDREDAVSVTFVCGYGTASQVPQAIKQAALLLISHWNNNREAVGTNDMAPVPLAVDALLSPYRRIGL